MSRSETKALDAWIGAVRYRSSIFDRPRFRRIALACALLLFASGILLSVQARPTLLQDVNPLDLLGVLALVPFTLSLNAMQFCLTSRLLGIRADLKRAFTITVLSTAGNLLPLPGGAAVRIAALKKSGEGYLRPTGLTIIVALFWMCVSSLVACVALVLLGHTLLSLLAATITLVLMPAVLYKLIFSFDARATWMIALASAQFTLALVGSVRLWLCFHALGEPILFEQTLVLLFSSVIAAFFGVAPGGLGITELSAAGLAGLIGVASSTAFIATALNRLTGLSVIALLAAIFGILDSRSERDIA